MCEFWIHLGFEIVPNREVLRSIVTRNTYFSAKKSTVGNLNLVFPENLVLLNQHLQGEHQGVFAGDGLPNFRLSFEEDLRVILRNGQTRVSSQVHCYLESETSTKDPVNLKFSEFPEFRRCGGSPLLASPLENLSELKELAVILEAGRTKIFSFLWGY